MSECSTERCDGPVVVRGWCKRCYMQKYHRGDFGPRGSKMPRGTREELLWRNIERLGPDECWPWLRSRDSKGYGKARIKKQSVAPHRLAYELAVGPIPDGYEVDHLCRNTGCCNPAHLEAVTPAENNRRKTLAKTHCKRGHEFTPENTNRHSSSGARVCRACVRDRQRDYSRARRAKAKALRGDAPRRRLVLTQCPQGHPYDGANTYLYHGNRQCRECRREAGRRWRSSRFAS